MFLAFVLWDSFFEFEPLLFDFGHCYFEDLSRDFVTFEMILFPSFIVLLKPCIVYCQLVPGTHTLLVHVVFYTIFQVFLRRFYY